jgi:nitrite reductase (cytochrome c-552)
MHESRKPPTRRAILSYLVVGAGAAVVTAATLALLFNIFERRQEARTPHFRVVELTDTTQDPEVWGLSYPHQYETYLRTVDQVRTRFGGSEALPREPDAADPRIVVAQSRLAEDQRLRTMWAGYAFAHDFREERGHAYMLEDQTFTGRQRVAAQPGTCIHCHASVYVPYRRLGDGDLIRGFERMNAMPYAEARAQVEHPVSCIDCHDPETMRLRVTRPAFIEGIRAWKAFQGVADYDVNRDATRQELRAFVCGQCHVEYYFRPGDRRLVYPWAQGIEVQQIYDYYQEIDFADWTHELTGARVLKAQHPEFELWNQGVHARAGVSCADCHMPYRRVGAFKVSDHHVRSPLLSVDRSCRTCHPVTDEELLARAERIQEQTFQLRDRAMDALVALIGDLEAARAAGRADARLDSARALQRRAQFYLDFLEAENSMGFHAPQEAARILGEAIDYARQGQIALRDAEGGT